MSKDFSVTTEKILDNARLVCYTFSIDKTRHLCYITIKRKVAMRVARMVYIKDMNLFIYLKDSIGLRKLLNISNAVAIKCEKLIVEHQGFDVKVKMQKDGSDETILFTHTSKSITVVWEKI